MRVGETRLAMFDATPGRAASSTMARNASACGIRVSDDIWSSWELQKRSGREREAALIGASDEFAGL